MMEEGQDDHMEELSNKVEKHPEGQGDCSAAEE
jgi:hypothetical protein